MANCEKHPLATIRRALEVFPFDRAPLSCYVADGLVCTECEKLVQSATPGPTGEFPQGKLNADDEGELKLMISHDEQNLVLDFGKPIAWCAMPKAQALQFAFAILTHCGVTIEQHDLTKAKPS